DVASVAKTTPPPAARGPANGLPPTGAPAASATTSSRKRSREEPDTAALKARLARRQEAPLPPAGAAAASTSGRKYTRDNDEPDTAALNSRLARRQEAPLTATAAPKSRPFRRQQAPVSRATAATTSSRKPTRDELDTAALKAGLAISPPPSAGALSGKSSSVDEPEIVALKARLASLAEAPPFPAPGMSDKRSRSSDKEADARAAQGRGLEAQRSDVRRSGASDIRRNGTVPSEGRAPTQPVQLKALVSTQAANPTQPLQQEALLLTQTVNLRTTDAAGGPVDPCHTAQGISGVNAPSSAYAPRRDAAAARSSQHDGPRSTAVFSDARKERPTPPPPPPPVAGPYVTPPVRAGNPAAEGARTMATPVRGSGGTAPARAESCAWSGYGAAPFEGEVSTPRVLPHTEGTPPVLPQAEGTTRVLPHTEGCADASPPIRTKTEVASPMSAATTASAAAGAKKADGGQQHGVPTAVQAPPMPAVPGNSGAKLPSSRVARPNWAHDASPPAATPPVAAPPVAVSPAAVSQAAVVSPAAVVPRAAAISACAAARESLLRRIGRTPENRTGEAPVESTASAAFSTTASSATASEVPVQSTVGSAFSKMAGSATAPAVAKRLMPVDRRGWMPNCLTSAPSPRSTAPHLQKAVDHAGGLTVTPTQAHASAPNLASLWRQDSGASVTSNTAADHHGRLATARGPGAPPPGDSSGIVSASPRRQTFGELSPGVAAAAAPVWINPKNRSVGDQGSVGAVTGSAGTGEASRDRDPCGGYHPLLAAAVGVSLSAQNNTLSIPYVPRFLGLQPAP
ncbi:unnamed protein product, partial [Laminaria digitata]